MYYVYVIRCSDNSLYTGYTKDIKKRITEHITKDKKGAKYTKSHDVIKVEGLWTCDEKGVAMSFECFLKTLKKSQKEEIINNFLKLYDYEYKYMDKITDDFKELYKLNEMINGM